MKHFESIAWKVSPRWIENIMKAPANRDFFERRPVRKSIGGTHSQRGVALIRRCSTLTLSPSPCKRETSSLQFTPGQKQCLLLRQNGIRLVANESHPVSKIIMRRIKHE